MSCLSSHPTLRRWFPAPNIHESCLHVLVAYYELKTAMPLRSVQGVEVSTDDCRSVGARQPQELNQETINH